MEAIAIVVLIASLFAPKTVSDAGLEHIKKYEGLRLEMYTCPAGKPTIGYGHQTKSRRTITKKQAEELLKQDLAPIEEHINSLETEFTQSQFDVVCSFAFNIGLHNFKNSTFSKTFDPEELKKWVYGNKKKLPGLVSRRQEEYLIYTQHDYKQVLYRERVQQVQSLLFSPRYGPRFHEYFRCFTGKSRHTASAEQCLPDSSTREIERSFWH